MHVQVVPHEPDHARVGEVDVDEMPKLVRHIDGRAALGHLHVPPPHVRREAEEETLHVPSRLYS
jgi:hypothetical protein